MPTGSNGKIITIGIVVVACFAASAATPAGATIRSTRRSTSSRASAGSRAASPSAQRYSMTRLRPSTHPSWARRATNAVTPRSTDSRVGWLR
jgi:hypothetical protein